MKFIQPTMQFNKFQLILISLCEFAFIYHAVRERSAIAAAVAVRKFCIRQFLIAICLLALFLLGLFVVSARLVSYEPNQIKPT